MGETQPAQPGNQARTEQILLISLLLLVVAAMVWLLESIPSGGVDYHFTFYPYVQQWFRGEFQIYTPATYGFYHPPWTLWIFALFGLLPYGIGLALLRFVSLLGLAAGALTFSPAGRLRPWLLAMALVNLYAFDLTFRGQIDAVAVAGVAAAWVALRRRQPWLLSLGYALLMSNPPNTVPVAIVFLWLSWRDWGWREMLISFTIPAILVLVSLFVFPGWPIRYATFYASNNPPRYWFATLWRAQEALGLPRFALWLVDGLAVAAAAWAWLRVGRAGARSEVDRRLARLMIVIALTILISPYVTSYRLMLLVAVMMPWMAGLDPRLTLGLYVLTFSPLLRLWVSTENTWVDVIFMVAAFVAVIVIVVRKFQPAPVTT